MACYVVLIGGTGHRVGKAIVHLAASGCFAANVSSLKLMCVDSDGGNKDFADLKELVEKYRKLDAYNVFATSIQPKNENIEELCWSPLADMSDMKTLLGKAFMSEKSGKKLLDFLYTDFEQSKTLSEGFYGHTSIGSLFMADQLMTAPGTLTPDWNAFLQDITDGDKIFVVGSAFGGTGASGVPTISRILKDFRPNVEISAILVMPYFKFTTEKTDGIIDYTAFTTKTKAAMSFYDNQNFNRIFKTLYIIGEDIDQFMNVGYSVGGNTQSNCPNAIELCAATALLDFLKSEPSAAFDIKLMTRDEENGLMLVTPNMLNKVGNAGAYDNLKGLLKFAVMYTKYYYHHFKEGKAQGAWYDKYSGATEEEVDALYLYCMNFIDWMKKIHLQTSANGELTNNVNGAIRLFRFSQECSILYDGQPVTKSFFGEKTKELDLISEIEFSANVGKKGEEIITDFNNAIPLGDGSASPIQKFYRTLLNVCKNS